MRPGWRLGAGVVLLGALGCAAWLLLSGPSVESRQPPAPAGLPGPSSASAAARRAVAAPSLGPPGEASLSIQGIVLGPQGPVAGARVLLTQEAPGESLSLMPCEGMPRLRLLECLLVGKAPWIQEWVEQRRGEVLTRGEVHSGEDGTFKLSGLEAGSYALWVESAQGIGFRPQVAAGSEPLEVRVARGTSLSGTVRDEAKVPVAGALVTGVFAMHSRFFEALTDATGHYQLGPLPMGELLMVGSKQGLLTEVAPLMAYSAEVQQDFELRRPRNLRGQVVRGKAPVAGAHVRAMALPNWELETLTDAQGRFSFEGVHPEIYRLWAWHGAEGTSSKVKLIGAEPAEDLMLELKPAVFIEGVVRDETHQPVKEARVEVSWLLEEDEREGGGYWDTRDTSTDEQGHYQLGPLPEGEHTLRVTAPGYRDWQEDARPLSVGVTSWDATLERAFVVEGVVVDPTGAPVADEGVELREKGEGTGWDMTMTGADGHFSLSVPEKGAHGLKLEGRMVHPQELEVLVPSGPLRIVAERLLEVPGEVVDEAGTPMTGAEVSLWPEQGAWNDKRTVGGIVDGMGRFSLHVGKPGRYRVTAELLLLEGLRTASRVVEVGQGGAAPVRLAFAEARPLTGVVVNWRGERVPQLALQVMTVPRTSIPRRCSPPQLCHLTDGEGRFRFGSVSAEQVDVCLRQEGYSVLEGASESPGCVRLKNDGREARVVVGREVFVTGRVVHADGSPVTRFRVNGRELQREDGELSLLIHRPGVERIELSAPGMQTVLRTAPEFPEGTQIQDLGTVVLSP